MVETTGEGSDWVWIRKHTGFVHGVSHDFGTLIWPLSIL